MKFRLILFCLLFNFNFFKFCFSEKVIVQNKSYDISSDILKDIFSELYRYPNLSALDLADKVEKKGEGLGFNSRTAFLRYVLVVVKPLMQYVRGLVEELEKLKELAQQTKEQQKDISAIPKLMDIVLDKLNDELKKNEKGEYYTEDRVAIFKDNLCNIEIEYVNFYEGIVLALRGDKEKLDEYANIVDKLQHEMNELTAVLERCKEDNPEESTIAEIEYKKCAVEDKIFAIQDLIADAQAGVKSGDVTSRQKELIASIGSMGSQIGIDIEEVFADYTALLKMLEEKRKQKALEEQKNQERAKRKEERRKRRQHAGGRRRRKREEKGLDDITKDICEEEMHDDLFVLKSKSIDVVFVDSKGLKLTDILQIAWEVEQAIM